MTCSNFLALPLIGFLHKFVQQFPIHEVRSRELSSVSSKFFFESFCGIHAQRFGFKNFQFEIDKQRHVFIKCLYGIHAVPIVFSIDVHKICEAHQFSPDFKHVRFGGNRSRIALRVQFQVCRGS